MPEISKKINDQVGKWIGIPVTGILVMHLSGFINISSRNPAGLLLDYLPSYSRLLFYGTAMLTYIIPCECNYTA